MFEEFWKTVFKTPPAITRRFWFNSGLAVCLMLLFAWNQGYKLIWPIFGAANQLLAALTLIAVTVWLHRMGKRRWFTLIPALVMLATTIGALSYCLIMDYLPTGNLVMMATDVVLLVLSLGVLALSLRGLTGSKPHPHVPLGA